MSRNFHFLTKIITADIFVMKAINAVLPYTLGILWLSCLQIGGQGIKIEK
jgi:hypothetical protein